MSEDQRWAALLSCFFVGSVTGMQYAFSVYSDALKDLYDLKQSQVSTFYVFFSLLRIVKTSRREHKRCTQLDTIPTFYYVGGFFSFLAGILNDRYGPQVVTLFGGIVTSSSVLAEWCIAKNNVPGVKIDDGNVVWLLSIANFIWALGNAMMTAPAFSTAIRNFPSTRGTVVGFCKGAVGIIGGLFTQLWAGFAFVPDKKIHTVDYLLAVAAYILITSLCALPFIKVYDDSAPSNSTRKRRIQFSYTNLFVLCVLVGVAAAMESGDSSSTRLGFAVTISCLVCTLFGVFAIRGTDSEDTQTTTTTTTTTAAAHEKVVLNDDNEDDDDHYRLGSNLSLNRIVRMRECWCLLLCAMALFGSGTMITSNLAQMVTARSMQNEVKSMGVSIFSFAQALSRMVCGMGADVLLLNASVPTWYAARTMRLAEASIIMALGHLIILISSSNQWIFLIGIGLTGIGFGALHPLLVVCTSELFGLKNHSTNYCFYDGWGSAISSLLLGQVLVQSYYESHTVNGDNDCYGTGCFQMPHVITSLVCLASACAAFYVTTCRALPLYRSIRLSSSSGSGSSSDEPLLVSSSSGGADDGDDNDDVPTTGRFATGAWMATA